MLTTGLAVAALLFFSPAVRAQFYQGPIATAMGGAGRAAVDPSESSFVNPASLSQLNGYTVAFDYAHGSHPVDGSRTTYAGLLADGGEERLVPGAFSYVNRFTEIASGNAAYIEQDLQAALSIFVLHRVSVGVSLHQQTYSPTSGVGGAVQNNMSLGSLWTPSADVGLAAVVYDIVPSVAEIPVALQQAPTYALGLNALLTPVFSVRADIVRPTLGSNNGRTNMMGGFQSLFRSTLLFRGGMRWQETEDKTLYSLGLGFHGPRLSVDYAYEKDVRVAGGDRHVIDLWMPF